MRSASGWGRHRRAACEGPVAEIPERLRQQGDSVESRLSPLSPSVAPPVQSRQSASLWSNRSEILPTYSAGQHLNLLSSHGQAEVTGTYPWDGVTGVVGCAAALAPVPAMGTFDEWHNF